MSEGNLWQNHLGMHLSDMFVLMYGLKKGDYLSPLFFNFSFKNAITKFQ